ncbi:Asp-tRNA(Asn)/Glu-tRNA(Gln) amidotransferase subunit GatC [Pseudohongiella sp.]|uniref:Aspartyl/glutamyl-tRNA(Asn/Gln) amidotransferase subunit C n=1 Tax=marine sediment metagenome TaxID=412755 RepID=A0A0F9W5D5_9ZZZZ|nr:Asp-tRNA(Asn)/Glu-tRNA(Gln) amidotransferase subunit GatC [Pseudohongiella sp.]HDZ07622.1 Asp-tRNA(Asn)/Glu-tRNA(Gln) amidotransferase subunit GatC [Pseudohongiella sp.]HEA63626.1 Asp-tRNA(Asn)/Glu-tRNA(Gln) amidotransferase subunit GatC [Pseudohongiella sp.]
MALNNTDVEKIAHLARLQISESDTLEVAQRISNILTMIDQMQNVDTSQVTPMAHPFDASQRLRPDVVTETDQRDYFQKLAPATQDGLYLVPKVIE